MDAFKGRIVESHVSCVHNQSARSPQRSFVPTTVVVVVHVNLICVIFNYDVNNVSPVLSPPSYSFGHTNTPVRFRYNQHCLSISERGLPPVDIGVDCSTYNIQCTTFALDDLFINPES